MLPTAPNHWTLYALMEHIANGPKHEVRSIVLNPGGPTAPGPAARKITYWVPSRPYGFYSLISRTRLAWKVFTGEYDALEWPGQQPKAY